eukprot:scaffold32715_cov47-Phaeocystis_antarctica.AAC.1
MSSVSVPQLPATPQRRAPRHHWPATGVAITAQDIAATSSVLPVARAGTPVWVEDERARVGSLRRILQEHWLSVEDVSETINCIRSWCVWAVSTRPSGFQAIVHPGILVRAWVGRWATVAAGWATAAAARAAGERAVVAREAAARATAAVARSAGSTSPPERTRPSGSSFATRRRR